MDDSTEDPTPDGTHGSAPPSPDEGAAPVSNTDPTSADLTDDGIPEPQPWKPTFATPDDEDLGPVYVGDGAEVFGDEDDRDDPAYVGALVEQVERRRPLLAAPLDEFELPASLLEPAKREFLVPLDAVSAVFPSVFGPPSAATARAITAAVLGTLRADDALVVASTRLVRITDVAIEPLGWELRYHIIVEPAVPDPVEVPSDSTVLGTDSSKWARLFAEVIAANPGLPFDRGAMIGWFANAIEAGRAAGRAEVELEHFLRACEYAELLERQDREATAQALADAEEAAAAGG